MGGARGLGRRQHRDLSRPGSPGAPVGLRGVRGGDPQRGGAGARRVSRAPGPRVPLRRRGRSRARGHARAAERGAPRRLRAVRRHSAGIRGRPLPLPLSVRAAPGVARADSVDGGRRGHGGRPPRPPRVGRAVPSRVDLHEPRRHAARELPPADAVGARRNAATGEEGGAPIDRSRGKQCRALRCVGGEAARPPPRARVRHRARFHPPLRGRPARVLARFEPQRRPDVALLVHGRQRRAARGPGLLRRLGDRDDRRPGREDGDPPGDDLRLPAARARALRGHHGGAPVRLRLRVRWLLRLRAEGGLRGDARPPLRRSRTRRSSSRTASSPSTTSST